MPAVAPDLPPAPTHRSAATRRYRLLIEYDGSAFAGWQVQPDQTTVQGTVEDALGTILRAPTHIVGSGRTDSGVHARGQVAHFDTATVFEPRRLLGSLAGLLPPSIAVRAVEPVAADFHARFDADRRRYHYYVSLVPRALGRAHRVHLRPAPDVALMNRAARDLLGMRDFDSFCRSQSAIVNRVCTVYHAAWHEEEREGALHFRVDADRFLHGMVRALVGTLVEIGRGKRSVDSIPAILAAKDRRAAGPAAPAHGLVLEHVGYPGEE